MHKGLATAKPGGGGGRLLGLAKPWPPQTTGLPMATGLTHTTRDHVVVAKRVSGRFGHVCVAKWLCGGFGHVGVAKRLCDRFGHVGVSRRL